MGNFSISLFLRMKKSALPTAEQRRQFWSSHFSNHAEKQSDFRFIGLNETGNRSNCQIYPLNHMR